MGVVVDLSERQEMAKLKAHGRELFRVRKEVVSEDNPDSIRTFRYSLHVDGWVLYKVDSFRVSSGERFPGHWKRYQRMPSSDLTGDGLVRLKERWLAGGFEEDRPSYP